MSDINIGSSDYCRSALQIQSMSQALQYGGPSRMNQTPTRFSSMILGTMMVTTQTGGRAGGRVADSRRIFAYREGLQAGIVEQVAISERAEELGEAKVF